MAFSRFREVSYLMAEGASYPLRSPRKTMWISALVATSFFVLGLALLLHHNASQWVDSWAGPQMSVRLKRGVSEAEVAELRQALAGIPAVRGVELVSHDEAVHRLSEFVEHDRELLALLREDISPAIEVAPRGGCPNVALVHPLTDRLAAMPQVISVDVQKGWSESVGRFLSSVREWMKLLVLLLFGASVLAVTLSVRLACAESGREVSLWRMLGARGGALIGETHGAVLGALGAGLGLLVLGFSFQLGLGPSMRSALAHLGSLPVVFLPPLLYCDGVYRRPFRGAGGSALGCAKSV